MKYQKLGSTDIDVSVVSFGCWGIGGGDVWTDFAVDARAVTDLLSAARDLGINYIDTAPVYGVGRSERILSEALKGRRDQFILQTKVSLNWRGDGVFQYERDGKQVFRNHTPDAIRKDVEGCLERLQTDYIDAIVLHRMSDTVPVSDTMGELQKMVQEGKIRAVLLSNSEPADLKEYAKYGTVAGVQEKFSILNVGKENYFKTCKEHNALFQVYGSLEEGALTGRKFYDKTFIEGDVRTSNRWHTEPYRSAILAMFDAFEPLLEKYECSLANLIQAWTLKQYESLNLLTGFRHISTMQDTCKVFEIELSAEDEAFMTREACKVRALGSPAKVYK